MQGMLGAWHFRVLPLTKYGKLTCRRKKKSSKFPASASFICDTASMPAAMLTDMIKNISYLMQSTDKG
jgi:hypothetical protein